MILVLCGFVTGGCALWFCSGAGRGFGVGWLVDLGLGGIVWTWVWVVLLCDCLCVGLG